MSEERAVSEVIAFVLVFAIVISSVALLYSVGFGGLSQLQESEQSASAQQAFEAFAVAMDDVQRDYREDQRPAIDLGGRTMLVDESAELEIEVENATAVDDTTASGALVYGRGADTELAYLGGAVLRDDDGAQITTREPRFRCRADEDRAVISVVELRTDRDNAFSSSDSVEIEATVQNAAGRRVAIEQYDANEVRIDYGGTPYEDGFEDYFQDADNEWTASGDTAECSFSGDGTVYVRKTVIELQFFGV